ncbi:hypothetical protein VP01_40g7 [Puccinia sorghi]|uniref:HAT C-terminal dimerisation domain-containing protein n=1 Tax=Puccinia sorghi TaxID=27349 RepID=A0A0L6URA6_9BASI|nr:hypothetical protein VP01_40g7 [Puccinia sorghi]
MNLIVARGILIISQPLNFCGARKNYVYLEAACQILGLIVMNLTIQKGSKLPANYLQEITSIKKKHFITKLSSTSYIFGFYVKKYLGPALKAHMFKKPFTTVKLDWSFSNGIGLQPLKISPLSITCGQQKETALGSLVHKSHLLTMIGILLFNIILKLWLPGTTKEALSYLAWECDKMHIKCFCHKIGLVLNYGLEKLGLEALPLPKLNKTFLGSVPYLNNLQPIKMNEEGSDCDVDEGEEDMDEDDNDNDAGRKQEKDGNDSNIFTSQQSNKKKNSDTNRNKSNKLHELTQIFFICSCFVLVANNKPLIAMGYAGKSIMKAAGVPIMQEKLLMKCSLLGHFKQIQFTHVNWMKIKHLNNGLKPFNYLTKEMKGDGHTSAFLMANYYQKIKYLKKKEASSTQENMCHPMYYKVMTKHEEFQEDVLECEAWVMTTLLHPVFHLKFYAHCWPKKEHHAQSLLEKHFKKKEKHNPKVDKDNFFALLNAPPNYAERKELEVYFKNTDCLPGPAAKVQKILLIWWNALKDFPCPIFFGQRLLSHLRIILYC